MTTPLGRRFAAGALFAAVTVLLGIVTHLSAEFAGLGWPLDAALIFSGRHAYLGVFALGSIVAGFAALLAFGPGNLRAQASAIAEALPFHGKGVGFTAAAFIAQFAFFVVSELGEGCPLHRGDIIAALIAAALTALCGALAVALGKRRMLEFVLRLVWAICAGASPHGRNATRTRVRPIVRGARCTPFSFRYRPPPQTA